MEDIDIESLKSPVLKRISQENTLRKYLKIVRDYNEGLTIKEIMERNNVKSPQTIYMAIIRVNKELVKNRKEKNGK